MRLSADNKFAIINALQRGAGIQEIADRYGVTRKTIQRLKKDSGIEPREVQAIPQDTERNLRKVQEYVDDGKPYDFGGLLERVGRNLEDIHRNMSELSENDLTPPQYRSMAARVAVEANAKLVAVATLAGAGANLVQAEGEQDEAALVREMVEGKGK